jgi:HlyD family secretion protein
VVLLNAYQISTSEPDREDIRRMEQKEIFRKVSLERLSSPEQLDMLTRVTTPAGWLALVVLGAILIMALVWGFWGSIPIKVQGQGILLSQGGIANVVTLGAGQVTEVVVKANDRVQRGQVVARIAQPVLFNELRNTRNELEETKTQHRRLIDFSRKDLQYQMEAFQAQRLILETSIPTLARQADFMREQLGKQQQLLEKGLIVPSRVETSRQALATVLENIESQKTKIEDLRSQEYSLKNRTENSLKESEFRINTLERNITTMENRLTYDSRVVSKVGGKVVEVKVSPGGVVSLGTPVISVESEERKLEAVLYIPAAEGKKVRPGMEIDLVPSSVKKEEYGSVLGLVAYVSDYPATYQGMVQVLENEQLARTLSRDAAPYAIRAELIPSAKTPSGFKWSSGKGPPISIQAGTICVGEITVEHKRPINYVIPLLKNKLGL